MESEIRNKIGKRIKQLRIMNGLTQEKFALMIGINRSYLADIEQGNRNFGIDTLDKIVKGFDVDYMEFFADDQTEKGKRHYFYMSSKYKSL